MPITLYAVTDLVNLQDFGNSSNNAVDLGTPPMTNISGSFSDNSFVKTGANNYFNSSVLQQTWSMDFNHANPLNPVPANAHITKIDILWFTTSTCSASISAVFHPGSSGFPANDGGRITATCQTQLNIKPTPMDGSIASVNNNFNFTDSHTGGAFDSLTPPTQNAAENPVNGQKHFTWDFTTNPGGQYPLGYMTYAQFLTNFVNMIFLYNVQSVAQAPWGHSGQAGDASITGTGTGASILSADTWQMTVEWNVPLQWTIAPATLVLPNDIITISRPDPGVPPDQDTQMIDELKIKDRIIKPNDPWVILWLRFLIIIHYPPDPPTNPVPIFASIIGTQFSGFVALGSLNITVADLSGIYTFDNTIHHDNLYARTTTSSTVTTQIFAIPAPFFVTAFFHDPEEEIMHYTGVRMRVTGQGTLKKVFQSLDNINNEQLADLILATASNTQPFSLANFIDQDMAIRVYMQSTDDYMAISKLIVYLNPIYTGYPL